ncbi:hypothetical protein [Erwinia amylovora]
MIRYKTVSYTHLDVDKRQAFCISVKAFDPLVAAGIIKRVAVNFAIAACGIHQHILAVIPLETRLSAGKSEEEKLAVKSS